MKRVALIIPLLALLLSFSAPCLGRGGGGGGGGGFGGGGWGSGGGGWGAGGGNGPGWGGGQGRTGSQNAGLYAPPPAPVRNVCDGRPFSFEGVVVHEIGPQEGQGLVMLVDGRTVTVYGIGPQRYWDGLALERPHVGQRLSVKGFMVDYNGVQRNMASHLTMEGRTVNLRQPGNCRPAWQPVPEATPPRP